MIQRSTTTTVRRPMAARFGNIASQGRKADPRAGNKERSASLRARAFSRLSPKKV